MQDHYLIDEDGTRTAIADLPTHVVESAIHCGVHDCVDVTAEDFLERLRIELVVRKLGL